MQREFINSHGLKYTKQNQSIIVQILSYSKENQQFTEEEIKKFVSITSNYLDDLEGAHNDNRLGELFDTLLVPIPHESLKDLTFYKFITKDTYDNYILKGKFQLGSLQFYREIENKSARDEKEGYSNLIIRSGNRDIFTSILSGFNFYIFCGTSTTNESKFMNENFGDITLQIPSIASFANAVSKSIGAKRWHLYEVRYSDFKAYLVKQLIKKIEEENGDLSDEMFDCFYKASFFPSLFVKPCRFNQEMELRLAFEMPTNAKRVVNFDNIGLLGKIGIARNA